VRRKAPLTLGTTPPGTPPATPAPMTLAGLRLQRGS
jgi:hypothetical protein